MTVAKKLPAGASEGRSRKARWSGRKLKGKETQDVYTSTQDPRRQPLGHDLAEHEREGSLVLGQAEPLVQEGRRRLEGHRLARLRRPADDGRAAPPGLRLDRQASPGRLQGPQGPRGSQRRGRRVIGDGRASARPFL